MIGLGVVGPALPLDEAEHPVLRERLAGRAYGQVDGMADPAGGQADLATKIVSLGVAQPGGHGLGLAGEQPVQGAARGEVQGVADVEQPLVRLADADVRPVGQPGGGQRPQHRHVAEAAAGLLEVGLEQVGRVTEGGEPLVEGRQQLRQPLAGVAAPGVQQRRAGALDQLGVAGDHPQVEQADAGAQLAAGDLGALGRRAYRVVNPDPRVPQRIPERLGQRR